MESGILLPLILTILILLFSRSRQKSAFREKETRLNDTIIRLQNELSHRESISRRRGTQHRRTTQSPQMTQSQQQEDSTPPTYNKPPPELLHSNAYWDSLSAWYREEQDWICEKCKIDLKGRPRFLHVHHIHGRRHNDPKYLIALCIACHSDQRSPVDHRFMKDTHEYRNFVKWRNSLRAQNVRNASTL